MVIVDTKKEAEKIYKFIEKTKELKISASHKMEILSILYKQIEEFGFSTVEDELKAGD